MQGNNAVYWKSYGLHEGTVSYHYCYGAGFKATRLCTLSIALDDSARFDFSATRIIVVCQKSVIELLGHLTMIDCPDPEKYLDPSLASRQSYRTRLFQRRFTVQRAEVTFSSNATCTIAFEAIVSNLYNEDFIDLIPYSHSTLTSYPHVLYDRTHPTTAAEPATFVLLESSIAFVNVPRPLRSAASASAITAHSVRVLRVPGRNEQRFYRPNLTPNIILHIVDFAIGEKPREWRQALLSYGLVSKSWVHVLDLFFARFDFTYDHTKSNVLAVAKTLERKPGNGALMRNLSCMDYTFWNSDAEDNLDSSSPSVLDAWQAFLIILRYAIYVTEVSVRGVPEIIVGPLVSGLSNLRRVQRLTIDGSDGPLNMTDVQAIISSWKELRSLDIRDWGKEKEQDSTTLPDPLSCNIRTIGLKHGTITGIHLLRFAPSLPRPNWKAKLLNLCCFIPSLGPQGMSNPCRLTSLVFQEVQGPTNSDFRRFLTLTAHTLRSIVLLQCSIPRASSKEELALDAVIANMSALKYVTVDGTHVSYLTLMRYKWHPPSLTQHGMWHASPSIVIDTPNPNENITISQVTTALAVTGWLSVAIGWDRTWDQELVDRARDAAEKRQITLHLYFAEA